MHTSTSGRCPRIRPLVEQAARTPLHSTVLDRPEPATWLDLRLECDTYICTAQGKITRCASISLHVMHASKEKFISVSNKYNTLAAPGPQPPATHMSSTVVVLNSALARSRVGPNPVPAFVCALTSPTPTPRSDGGGGHRIENCCVFGPSGLFLVPPLPAPAHPLFYSPALLCTVPPMLLASAGLGCLPSSVFRCSFPPSRPTRLAEEGAAPAATLTASRRNRPR